MAHTQQTDALDYQEDRADAEAVWRRNYAAVDELTDIVLEVLEDQAKRATVAFERGGSTTAIPEPHRGLAGSIAKKRSQVE